MTARRAQSAVAGISLVYDLSIGLVLLAAADWFAALFGVAVPEPRTFVTLTGLFLTCVGLGYVLPMRNPDQHRGYLWIFGPLLKGAGAVVFICEHQMNGAPKSYLLFASTDGALALATLWALLLPARER